MSKHRIRPAELAQLERLSPADLKRPRKLRSQRITDHQDMPLSLELLFLDRDPRNIEHDRANS
ncbi:MAG: hypothetical protein BYD32DRAFT_89805 [Podila humilis]|nr:MAG: hypothetical protein BYD32DRAFT_89805 [Podila humilis]